VTRALVMVFLAAVGTAAADAPPLPEVSAALARIADASTIELTTTGRKTGKPHTKPIWFVVDAGKLVVQAGKDGKTDWYRNLAKSPTATVRQGDYTFRVRAQRVEDRARVDAIHRLFLKKYTSAWLLSFVGSSIGRGRPVELEPIAVFVQRGSSK
jgi:deazaflavin-dependent oxidoreductase (nitroreductase family)